MTRSSVTTKWVKFHSRYLRASQPAQTTAAIPHKIRSPVFRPPRSMKAISPPTTNRGIPLAMCFEKNHQCGRRSSAISSPSFSSFLGYGTVKFYARRTPQGPDASRSDVAVEQRQDVVAVVRVEVD